MPDKFTYLLVDLSCIIVPFIFSFYPKINFRKEWKYFFLPCIFTALFFLGWDVLFTHAGIWSFNTKYVYGIYLYNLPLEECLFFLCIPYACVFTYYCINKFVKLKTNIRSLQFFSFTLIVLLSTIGLSHLSQLYTSVTFLLLALLLLLANIKKMNFLPSFYISFTIILIPFFVSNGVLTGSIANRPTVLYNNHYNLGVRIFTIPIEDLFYAMLLLLMNIIGFEYLKGRTSQQNQPLTI